MNGYRVENLGPALNYELSLPLTSQGVVVVEAPQGGYGFVQMQPGDMMVSVNGKAVSSINDLKAALANPRPRGWQFVIKRGTTLLQMVIQ
jgi:S1-C subfamily serine protease